MTLRRAIFSICPPLKSNLEANISAYSLSIEGIMDVQICLRASNMGRSNSVLNIKRLSNAVSRFDVRLVVAIKYFAYPMDLNYGGIYSPDVTVFRNAHDLYYFAEDTYKVGIVSVAALDFNEKHGKNLEYRAKGGGFM